MIFGEENVFVRTERRFDVEARELQNGFLPEGFMAIGFFVDDRLVTQRQAPKGSLAMVHRSGLLAEPRSIGLIAHQNEEGVHATVVLVLDQLPEGLDADEETADTPWAASGPRLEGDEDGLALPYMALIGSTMRSPEERIHPDDLGHEAADMLARLMHHDGALTPEQRAVEELLQNLDEI